MIQQNLVVGKLQTNCYVLTDEATRETLIIDPGADAPQILAAVRAQNGVVRLIVLTHYHFDHLLAAAEVRAQTGAPLAIHALETELLTDPPRLLRAMAPNIPRGLIAERALQDDEIIQVSGIAAQVLHTPGHSPGGISLWIAAEGVVFSGDALFRQGIGRTDFPGCSEETLLRSIRERLLTLPAETVVYPGHGPHTTIGAEKRLNPWLSEARRNAFR
jgi:glyoxylase-like metal-dependent hydrolase (beta-lactamase superfamily II)